MIKYLKLEDTFDHGRYKGKTVREVIEKDRKRVITLQQEGFYFDDEVLKHTRYTRTIRDERIIFEFVDRKPIIDKKKYKKDSVSVDTIIKDLSTLEKDNYSKYEDVLDDTVTEDFENE